MTNHLHLLISASTVNRRYEAATRKARNETTLAPAKDLAAKKYRDNIAILHLSPHF
jgi:hypothetical protein